MESTTLAQLHEEVKSLKGEVSQLRALVNNEQKKKKREEEERSKMAEEALVSKVDAADILMVSPRHLQRIRHKIGLRWKKNGRDSYYYMESILYAIRTHKLPWNSRVYEKVRTRVLTYPTL